MGLGIKWYYDKYLVKIGILEFVGCFVMIEIGYGLNVWGLEIIVEYDYSIRSFIIYMLYRDVGKEYIGNVLYG